MNYTVYKHTSPSGKIYIGITKQDVKKRWQNGLGYAHSIHFLNAIKKYGWHNISHEILYTNLSKEEACQKEVELIALYKSNQREFGYNTSNGGECGAKFTEETRRKISERLKGRTLSEEHRQHISESHKGGVPWNKGLKIPRQQNSLCGTHRSEETKQKISEKLKGKYIGQDRYNAIKINQFTKDKKFIRSWDCIADVEREMGFCHSNIIQCCKGRIKTAYGYVWEYCTEVNNNE